MIPVVFAVVSRNCDNIIKPIEELDAESICDGRSKCRVTSSNHVVQIEATEVDTAGDCSDYKD